MVDSPTGSRTAASTTEHERTFAVATAVRRGEAAGTYDIDVDDGFTVGPKPNGGYLLAGIARAAVDQLASRGSTHAHPLVATAHYLGAPDPGPAAIEVEILREGRSASQVRAVMSQDDRRCVDVTLTMGTLPDAGTAPVWSSIAPFEVAPREQCVPIPLKPTGNPFRIMERFDLRLDPSVLAFTSGTPSGRGEIKGWISFGDDDRPIDPLALLLFLDALPPATFEISLSGWVPTLSLTTYLRAVPRPGPFQVRMAAQQVSGGRVDEVCELWDSSGTLVGQATQLAAIRFDDPDSITAFPG